MKINRALMMLCIISFAVASANAQVSDSLRIVIIRHGEKPASGNNLTCAGFDRSLQLVNVLYKKIGIPDEIFVPEMNMGKSTGAGGNARDYQTIVPFIIKYNVRVNTEYDDHKASELAAALLKKKGTVLLVWEHKVVKVILKGLGITDIPTWSNADFDTILFVTFKDGKPTLVKDKEGIIPKNKCP